MKWPIHFTLLVASIFANGCVIDGAATTGVDYRLHVTDASTHEPIADAKVDRAFGMATDKYGYIAFTDKAAYSSRSWYMGLWRLNSESTISTSRTPFHITAAGYFPAVVDLSYSQTFSGKQFRAITDYPKIYREIELTKDDSQPTTQGAGQ